MAAVGIGLIGKLPASADFLRVRAHSELFEGLLTWLIDGTERAIVAGRGAPEGAAATSVQAMVYPARRGGTLLAGALAPSSDRAGRRFPIVAAAELRLEEAFAAHPEVLPLVLEPIWAATARLVLELAALDRAAVDAGCFSAELELNVADVLPSYRRWTDELGLDDFVTLVFDGDAGRAARGIALAEEAVRPYRGVEEPDTPLSLRLPLGQSGGAAVCFWLDFIKRLAGWRHTVPAFFWSHDGVSGALLLHLGKVPAVALSEVWLPTGKCDEVCDLVLPGSRDWHTDQVGAWERVLGEADARVSDLLGAAGQVQRSSR
jgi:type VI secretion system ImpM family protein